MTRHALRLYRSVGFRDYGRIDFRLDDTGRPFLLEANTHPHLALHSDFFTLWRARGGTHSQLLAKIVEGSLRRCGLAT